MKKLFLFIITVAVLFSCEEQQLTPTKKLYLAIRNHSKDNNQLPTVKALIQAGANVNAQTKNGRTPLHYAESPDTVKALIQAGANVHAQDKNGLTPLSLVKKKGIEHWLTHLKA